MWFLICVFFEDLNEKHDVCFSVHAINDVLQLNVVSAYCSRMICFRTKPPAKRVGRDSQGTLHELNMQTKTIPNSKPKRFRVSCFNVAPLTPP